MVHTVCTRIGLHLSRLLFTGKQQRPDKVWLRIITVILSPERARSSPALDCFLFPQIRTPKYRNCLYYLWTVSTHSTLSCRNLKFNYDSLTKRPVPVKDPKLISIAPCSSLTSKWHCHIILHWSVVILGCREQPPRGAPWVSGLVGYFVQNWPDSECSHTVQCLDCSDLNWRCNHYHLFWHGMTLLVLMCR